MKRTKRLSIEFRHREVVLTVAGSAVHVQNCEPDAAYPPSVCPTCGSAWIAIVAQMDGHIPANTDFIHHALEQSGLHLQVSRAGQLRICKRSFDQLKEKF
jgi:hypothetical protein